MTYRRVPGAAPTDHYAAALEECEGRTPQDAATTEIAVQNAMRTIEALMCEDRVRRRRDGLPDLVLPDDLAAGPAPREPRAWRARRSGCGSGQGSGRARGTMARLLAWRPGPMHAAWALAFAAVLLWPKVVLIGLFAGFVICLVGVALFGPEILERLRDGVMRLVGRGAEPRAARGASGEDEMPEPDPGPFEQRLRDLRG